MLDRNEGRRIDLECRYEGCGKVCLSKGGLVQHQKRMHRAPLERVRFECGKCGMVCETEVACLNHERTCGGGSVRGRQRECGDCGRWVSRSNFARHVGVCRERSGGVAGGGDVLADDGDVGGEGSGEGTRGKVAVCPQCRKRARRS